MLVSVVCVSVCVGVCAFVPDLRHQTNARMQPRTNTHLKSQLRVSTLESRAMAYFPFSLPLFLSLCLTNL